MGLTRSEQYTLVAVTALILAGFGLQLYRADSGQEGLWVEPGEAWRPLALDSPTTRSLDMAPSLGASSVTAAPQTARVDINRADPAELTLLPGIGPAKAAAIIDYRGRNGSFARPEDLIAVKGIGPKTLENLRPFITLGDGPLPIPPPSGSARIQEPAQSPSPDRESSVVPPAKIDLNRASAQELESLPGIGPVLAQRIIDYRRAHPFRSVDELEKIRGIGPKTMERLRDRVHLGEST